MTQFVRYRYEPVKMLPHNPLYGEIFLRIKKLVESDVSSCEVAHFGSTSIAGMVSKPIIDIFVLTDEQKIPMVVSTLKSLGFHDPYWREPSGDDSPPVMFAGIVTDSDQFNIHAHISSRDSKRYRDTMYFRDKMLSDPDLFDEYAALKMSAVNKGIPTVEANNGYKDGFMAKVFKIAEKPQQ